MSEMTNRTRIARPFQCLLIEKLTTSVLELADRGLAESSGTTARKIETPLVRLGVIETHAHSLKMACRTIRFELEKIGTSIPDLTYDTSTLVLNPGVRN